jgi:hypothetical protein
MISNFHIIVMLILNMQLKWYLTDFSTVNSSFLISKYFVGKKFESMQISCYISTYLYQYGFMYFNFIQQATIIIYFNIQIVLYLGSMIPFRFSPVPF